MDTAFMKTCSRYCCLFAWVVLYAALAEGATATRLELETDGSSAPPGDRIDLSILFFPGEDSISLEVRAFAILEGKEAAVPVAARIRDQQGPKGELLVTRTVRKPKDALISDVSVVVPYASLALPRGMHQLAYEVIGRRGAQIEFVKATRMAHVIVSGKTRTSMMESKADTKLQTKRELREAVVVSHKGVSSQKVEIQVPEAVTEFTDQTVAVKIPGEFSRPLAAMAPAPGPDPPSQEDEDKDAAVPLMGRAWQALAKFEPQKNRTIYFATNRNVVNSREFSSKRFGKVAGDLNYGTCVVNIPVDTHMRGKLEVPAWWEWQDPKRHFLIESLSVLERDAFRTKASEEDVLLFIHGFNTNFEFSVLRTGQLVHDLRFPGMGLAFSWPSAGSVSGYFQDEKQAQASVPALVELFRNLAAKSSTPRSAPRRVHVIAHSMGNRVFLLAARQFELERGKDAAAKLFGQVALAAPDIDGAQFGAVIPSLVRQADHVTLYYCQQDRALEASRSVHLDKPVGLGPCFAEGIDTINAELVNTEILGHGYYASSHELLIDLRLLILYKLLPDQRLPPIGNRSLVLGFPHWTFLPPRY